MSEAKVAGEERKVKRGTGNESDSYEEYKSDEETVIVDDENAERKAEDMKSVTVSKDLGQMTAEILPKADKAVVETDDKAKKEADENKERRKKKEKHNIDGEGEISKQKGKKKKLKKTKEEKKDKKEKEQRNEENQNMVQETAKKTIEENTIKMNVEAVNETEMIMLEKTKDEQEKKHKVEKIETEEEHKHIEEQRKKIADETKKENFEEEKKEQIITAYSSQMEKTLTAPTKQLQEAEENQEILPGHETVLLNAFALSFKGKAPLEEASEEASTEASAQTGVVKEAHLEDSAHDELLAAESTLIDESAQLAHEDVASNKAADPEPSAPEDYELQASEAGRVLSENSGIHIAAARVKDSELKSHFDETATEEKPKGLPRGVNEILEYAKQVAEDNSSVCSSRVLKARNLISRQEKLREQLMSIRHQFSDIDSEIRAFMNETFATHQRPMARKF